MKSCNIGQLLFQVCVGFLISFFLLLQGTNSLDCYECKHGEPEIGNTIPNYIECIDPGKAKVPVNRTTCEAPMIACMTGFGVGDYYGLVVRLLIRQCFLPESGQKEPDGCKDFSGNVYGNGSLIDDNGNIVRSPMMSKSMMESVTKHAESRSRSGGSGSQKKEGRNIPDHLHMTGKYCWCDGKDVCNGEADTNFPISHAPHPVQGAIIAIPRLILFLFISGALDHLLSSIS